MKQAKAILDRHRLERIARTCFNSLLLEVEPSLAPLDATRTFFLGQLAHVKQ
jgi:hypothetical protein